MGPEPDPTSDVPGMQIWGWMSPDELTWLRETAATMSSVVEIGALHGRTSFALLTGCPGPVYCVDPWDDVGGYCLRSFMRSCGHFPNVRPTQGYSPTVTKFVPDVDMVFIDGAHDADSVRADIEGWLPKCRRLICGHDYYDTDAWPVKTVVDGIFGDRVVEAWPGSAIWTVHLDHSV